MATPTPPQSARRYYAVSALVASRAATQALSVKARGIRGIWNVVARSQIQQAVIAEQAVATMLREQEIDRKAEALLNSTAFTTEIGRLEAMIEQVDNDAEFQRLVASITQDAGRAAQSVSVATRDRVAFVRHLNLPSCSRCAVLAGRVYRYSTGFLRHPGCDCVMIPTTIANPDLTYDVAELARDGQVTGLSKADQKAIADGADIGRVINVRSKSAGLKESGRVLSRAGRLTPEGIYRAAGDDRARALELLASNGDIR